MDSLVGRYKIKMKTSKWTSRVFFHLIDVALVNAYILYHREMKKKNRAYKMELGQFRTNVAEFLCTLGEVDQYPKQVQDVLHLTQLYQCEDESRICHQVKYATIE